MSEIQRILSDKKKITQPSSDVEMIAADILKTTAEEEFTSTPAALPNTLSKEEIAQLQVIGKVSCPGTKSQTPLFVCLLHSKLYICNPLRAKEQNMYQNLITQFIPKTNWKNLTPQLSLTKQLFISDAGITTKQADACWHVLQTQLSTGSDFLEKNGFKVVRSDDDEEEYFLTSVFSKITTDNGINDLVQLLLLASQHRSTDHVRTKKFKNFLKDTATKHCSTLHLGGIAKTQLQDLLSQLVKDRCPHHKPILHEIWDISTPIEQINVNSDE